MNELRNRELSIRSLLTTYDDEFPLDNKECLMFMETTGLKASKSVLTVVSLAYNKKGSGHIIQVYNFDEDESTTVDESLEYLRKFDRITIVNNWFETYYSEKINQYEYVDVLPFDNINKKMKLFYQIFNPKIDINDEAVKSIRKYKTAIKQNSKKMKDDYLRYNRNHSLAYKVWKV